MLETYVTLKFHWLRWYGSRVLPQKLLNHPVFWGDQTKSYYALKFKWIFMLSEFHNARCSVSQER